MGNLYKEFKNLWELFVNETMEIVYSDYEDKFDDEESVKGSEEYKEEISKELSDAGFSKDEYLELIEEDTVNDKYTLYKIIAFLLCTEDLYSNIEELKEVIENAEVADIDNYTDEDLDHILRASNEISW